MSNRGATRIGCADFRHNLQTSRRGFLKAGLLGAAGLSLGDLLRVEAAAGSKQRLNSVIILWMRGGPSHHDMWDPKPDAPADIRGEFGVSRTSVPGIMLSDQLPLSAKAMDKWTIIRSLHHNDAGHSTGDQICFTGYPTGPNPDENLMPSCGSIVSKQLGHLTPQLPAYVMVPRNVPGTGAAYLGTAHKAFETGADPANPGPFRVPNFELPQGLTRDRFGDRKELLTHFDTLRRDADRTGQIEAMDRFGQQAWSILTSSAARDAFDLSKEPEPVRERYGYFEAFDPKASDRCGCPAWSQRILLARRLVEAGVRLVTVDLRWWDTHVKGFESLKQGFLPRWDRAYTALLEDLEQRGLLESTLVVAWGEFGRTPKVNKDAGRDHYPNVFSAALAGGPVQGGRVVGESDEKGAYPKACPKAPQDVLATMYRHLGVDVEAQYLDNAGRPHPVLPNGKPIEELS
ncbi:MAG: DUF1501 domain-containing protein [Planctomycetia bacterium]|nr:DUF1501 domain-containing protein [Planctomycetia bacterium]